MPLWQTIQGNGRQEKKIGTGFDCNGNGIEDSIDVAQNPSIDCNANGIPDSCDIISGFDPDCDSDTVPNSCDLFNNDCDLDGGEICIASQGACANFRLNESTDPDCINEGHPDWCSDTDFDGNTRPVPDFDPQFPEVLVCDLGAFENQLP